MYFEYEHEHKPCEIWHKPGHIKAKCHAFKQNQASGNDVKKGVPKRGKSRSANWRKNGNHSKSWPPHNLNQASSSKPGENKNDTNIFEVIMNEDMAGQSGSRGHCDDIPPDIVSARVEDPPLDLGLTVNVLGDKGKKPMECEPPRLDSKPSNVSIPVVVNLTTTKKKEKKKNKKKKNKKVNAENSEVNVDMHIFFEDLEKEGSCDT